MRPIALICAVAAACLTLAGPAAAADRYAAPGGTGPAMTCPQNDPCDVNSAADDANTADGDNVILAAGHYTVSTPIIITHAINLHGTSAPTDTVIASSANSNYPLFVQNPGAVLSGFEIDTTSNWPAIFLVSGAADHVIARNSAYTACSGGNSTFSEVLCASTANFGHGFSMNWGGGTQVVKFRNSTFVGGGAGFGISINNGSSPSGNAATTIDLMSVIATGGSGGISLQSGCVGCSTTMDADHSNYPPLTLGGVGTLTVNGSASNQTAAPLFKDAAAGDFSELANSPTVDAGAANADTGTTDLAGLARTIGTAPDIGAYEYGPPAPPADKDTTAPVVTVVKKPRSRTTSHKLKVGFAANETATFKCTLDSRAAKSCTSPYRAKVKKGRHKLRIQATDSAGNASAVVTVRWKVTK